jgi:hypothetical protein
VEIEALGYATYLWVTAGRGFDCYILWRFSNEASNEESGCDSEISDWFDGDVG